MAVPTPDTATSPAPAAPEARAEARAEEADALTAEEREVLASPEARQQTEAYLDETLAYNLDEVTPLPVRVSIRERHEVTEEDPETKKPITRWRWRARTAEIETFVPMRVFNRMWALRQAAMAERREWLGAVAEVDTDTDDEIEEDPIWRWQLACVWSVWKLTEPDTTLQALHDGLSSKQVMGLFARFFGEALRQASA